MKIVWRETALSDLERIDVWLSQFESSNPVAVRSRILAAVSLLDRLGDIGRPGQISGTRELSVRTSPYLIVYRCEGETIEIISVYHSAEDR